jgi:hypothetical protein
VLGQGRREHTRDNVTESNSASISGRTLRADSFLVREALRPGRSKATPLLLHKLELRGMRGSVRFAEICHSQFVPSRAMGTPAVNLPEGEDRQN